ncbi:hypothetical protein HFP70_35870 [Streptomyces sp. ARC14]|uniref:hypothetical protein n=1 Tax=Streptomyces sp. ARC14 TaxID=2724152 RepID=UPI003857E7F0
MTGVELDPITAGISKALYPHANIRNEGFEKTRAADGTFDLTVGNVPFGDTRSWISATTRADTTSTTTSF